MSVQVNLLPREIEDQQRARRQKLGALGAVAGLVGVLAGAYAFRVMQINDAKEELAAEEAIASGLQAEVSELAEFQDLASSVDAVQARLAGTLGAEVSMAGLLQDVAAVMPSDAALTTLSVTLGQPDAQQAPDAPATATLGEVVASGESVNGHAPGVERLLLSFEKVAAFTDTFVSSSALDEEADITTFSIDFDLGPEVLTGRYLEGLPEELR